MRSTADVIADSLMDGFWEAFLWAVTRNASLGFLAILVRSRSGRMFAIYDGFSADGSYTGLSETAELFDTTPEKALDEIEAGMSHTLAPLGAEVHRVLVKGNADKMEELLLETPLRAMIQRTWHVEVR